MIDPRNTPLILQAPAAPALTPVRRRIRMVDAVLFVAAAVAMQAAALLVIYGAPAAAGWPWGLTSTTGDLPIYFSYASKMARGLLPFRDFMIEYPPLFVPFLWATRNARDLKAYIYAFEQMMAAWSFAAVVLTAIAAEGAERGGPYVSAAVFALGTAAIGGLAINRYDMAVAALIALFLLAMVRGWWEVAGIAIGLGFAMKIAPVLLLPLLLIVAPWKRGLLALACFAVAGFAPFVWFLLSGPLAATNLQDMALYHLARPLELEAVLGTPLWAASLFAGPRVEIIRAANSLALDGPGAALAASLAGPLSGIGVLVAYGLALWRRCALRTDRRLIVMPVLAVLLTFLVFAKVLSPQYLIWTLAPMALVFAGRRTLGLLLLLTTALTQTVFPIGYRAIEAQWPQGVSLLVVRNVLIIVCAALALVHLARLRAVEEPASEARHDAVGREEAADPYAPSDVPALA